MTNVAANFHFMAFFEALRDALPPKPPGFAQCFVRPFANIG
jgi:hypothetical protein